MRSTDSKGRRSSLLRRASLVVRRVAAGGYTSRQRHAARRAELESLVEERWSAYGDEGMDPALAVWAKTGRWPS